MSPIEFGPPPFELVLPAIDVNQIGSVMLTVWQLANSYSIIIVAFFLVLAVSAVGWLYKFVTHRRSADDFSESWKE
jgi:hypothetical protein